MLFRSLCPGRLAFDLQFDSLTPFCSFCEEKREPFLVKKRIAPPPPLRFWHRRRHVEAAGGRRLRRRDRRGGGSLRGNLGELGREGPEAGEEREDGLREVPGTMVRSLQEAET